MQHTPLDEGNKKQVIFCTDYRNKAPGLRYGYIWLLKVLAFNVSKCTF